MRNRIALAALVLSLPALLSLKGCETLSTPSDAEPRTAHVSASIRQGCADPVFIPAGIDRNAEYRLWGQDRIALVDCKQRDAAKGKAIDALTGQGAE